VIVKRKHLIVMDLDGTLLDSRQIHTEAYHRTLCGVLSTENADSKMSALNLGLSTRDQFEVWFPDSDSHVVGRLVLKKQQYVSASFREGKIKLFPDVVDALRNLADKFVFALCTGGSRRTIDAALVAGLDEFEFATLVHKSPEVRGKPYPDLYQAVLESCFRKGLYDGQKRAIAIEDTAEGLKSALAAGLDACWINRDGRSIPHLAANVIQIKNLNDFDGAFSGSTVLEP